MLSCRICEGSLSVPIISSQNPGKALCRFPAVFSSESSWVYLQDPRKIYCRILMNFFVEFSCDIRQNLYGILSKSFMRSRQKSSWDSQQYFHKMLCDIVVGFSAECSLLNHRQVLCRILVGISAFFSWNYLQYSREILWEFPIDLSVEYVWGFARYTREILYKIFVELSAESTSYF